MDKAIWQCSPPEHKSILITILMMANHNEKQWLWKNEKYFCKPGQLITSLKSIAFKSGTSVQNVRTALKNFEKKYDFLTNESTKQNRLITITNWDTYQENGCQPNKATNNQLTDDQQTPNKRLTTNKNDKECKNERKILLRENDFNEFYKAYPVKKSKNKAQEYWNKWEKAGELPSLEILLSALNNQIAERIRKKQADKKSFVPEWKHPSTWLHQKCWEDETEESDDEIKSRLTESGYDPVTGKYMTKDGNPELVL